MDISSLTEQVCPKENPCTMDLVTCVRVQETIGSMVDAFRVKFPSINLLYITFSSTLEKVINSEIGL
jgi:hypothetical protein